jgi:CBS domain containing-hemolysin-like protein
VVGYVLKDELLARMVDGDQDTTLSQLRREIIAVPEDYPIVQLLNMFLRKREHIALVVDEFGGMAGIATMEDLIETLLGVEIIDESDSTPDMQTLARSNWERRARRIGLVVEPSPESITDATQPPDTPQGNG